MRDIFLNVSMIITTIVLFPSVYQRIKRTPTTNQHRQQEFALVFCQMIRSKGQSIITSIHHTVAEVLFYLSRVVGSRIKLRFTGISSGGVNAIFMNSLKRTKRKSCKSKEMGCSVRMLRYVCIDCTSICIGALCELMI